MDGACARAAGGGGSWWCLLVRGAPLASYGLVAHFPSCSPVVVVVVVAHVFEQRLTRLAYVLVRVCLRVRCLSVCQWSPTTAGDESHLRGCTTRASVRRRCQIGKRRWTPSPP